jgi:hypothetical protein
VVGAGRAAGIVWQFGSVVINGNPAQAGTFNFTVKATDGNLTSTLAYQITITVQGLPDQLLCDPADNGGFLESGTCALPDAVVGQPYQGGHLVTSQKAGGTLNVVAGALPAGLLLPATFTGSGDTIGGIPGQPGTEATYTFTVQGTGDQGQPLYQAYSITVDPRQPLTVVLPASGSTLFPGTVGQAFGVNFFLSGGAAPYTWALVSGQLPTGMHLQTFSDPRRRQRDDRNTDHRRHVHLDHAGHRLPGPAGHPAVHHHPALSAPGRQQGARPASRAGRPVRGPGVSTRTRRSWPTGWMPVPRNRTR